MANKASIVIESEAHAALRVLARIHLRHLGAEVEWLIARELERQKIDPAQIEYRGIDPDTLEPKPPAPSSTADSESAPSPSVGA